MSRHGAGRRRASVWPSRPPPGQSWLGRDGVVSRLVRYGGVSAVATATSFAVLAALVGRLGRPAGWSAMAASCAGTLPAFQLNWRWVRGQGARASARSKVVPYAAIALAAMALASLASHLAGLGTAERPHRALAPRSAPLPRRCPAGHGPRHRPGGSRPAAASRARWNHRALTAVAPRAERWSRLGRRASQGATCPAAGRDPSGQTGGWSGSD
jgi:putative flippase GtrA